MSEKLMAMDGYANRTEPLREGNLRKGGVNAPVRLKDGFERPAPAPMRAANPASMTKPPSRSTPA